MHWVILPGGRAVNLAAYRQFEFTTENARDGATVVATGMTSGPNDHWYGQDADFLRLQIEARDEALRPFGEAGR